MVLLHTGPRKREDCFLNCSLDFVELSFPLFSIPPHPGMNKCRCRAHYLHLTISLESARYSRLATGKTGDLDISGGVPAQNEFGTRDAEIAAKLKSVHLSWCEKCFQSFGSKKKLRKHLEEKHSY